MKNAIDLDSWVDTTFKKKYQENPGKVKLDSVILANSWTECRIVYANMGASTISLILNCVKMSLLLLSNILHVTSGDFPTSSGVEMGLPLL